MGAGGWVGTGVGLLEKIGPLVSCLGAGGVELQVGLARLAVQADGVGESALAFGHVGVAPEGVGIGRRRRLRRGLANRGGRGDSRVRRRAWLGHVLLAEVAKLPFRRLDR